jgi:hypothetical protein
MDREIISEGESGSVVVLLETPEERAEDEAAEAEQDEQAKDVAKSVTGHAHLEITASA